MLDIIAIAILFAVGSVVKGVCLWLGMKITKVQGNLLGMLVIGAVSTLAGIFIAGFLGTIVSTGVMFFLIYKWTDVNNIFPDAVLMVIVANILSFFAYIGVGVVLAATLLAASS